MRRVGARLARLRHGELLPDLREELVRAEAVEVLHDPVVVHDAQLVVREEHREEVVVRLVAAMVPVGRFALEANAGGRRGPVVSVGDVERPNRSESLLKRCRLLRRDCPDRVADSVGRDDRADGRHGLVHRPLAILNGRLVSDDLFAGPFGLDHDPGGQGLVVDLPELLGQDLVEDPLVLDPLFPVDVEDLLDHLLLVDREAHVDHRVDRLRRGSE